MDEVSSNSDGATSQRNNPFLLSTSGIKGIQLVVSTDIDKTIGHRWRGANVSFYHSDPLGLSTSGIKGIQLVIIRTYIDDAIGYYWRGEDNSPGRSCPFLM